MKKKLFILGISTLLICGCGKIPTLSNGDEAVVSFKDNKMISVNELYEEIKNTYGLQALVNMIDKYVFETEFKDQLSDAETYASALVKQFKAQYETEDEALQMLQSYYGYQTFEAYEESAYLSYLQNHAIETYVNNNITEKELKAYYENNVYPSMTISHILITPKVTDDLDEEATTKAEKEAKDTINNIIKELKQAKKDGKDITETFSKLAKEYSEDDSTKEDGGNLGEIKSSTLTSEYDELISFANKLNDGEFSTELITTEAGYHVILKTKTGEKTSYDDLIDTMKDKITEDKLTENDSLMIDAIRHYRDKYELDIIDSELDSQYSTYMNNLINYYNNN